MSTRAKKCPLCGEVNGVLAKNCFMCDTALPDTRPGLDDTPADDWFRQQIAQGTAQPTLTSASASIQPSQQRARHCTDCGEPVNGTVNFCPNCGSSIYAGRPSAQATSVSPPPPAQPAPPAQPTQSVWNKPLSGTPAQQPTTQPTQAATATQDNPLTNLVVWLVLVFVVLPFGCNMFRGTGPLGGVTHTVINMNEYNQVQTGMSYEECVRVIGAEGTQNSRTDAPELGLTVTSYVWQNADGSNMIGQFQNNKLTTKAQAGL